MSSGIVPTHRTIQHILAQLIGPIVTVSDANVCPLNNDFVADYVSEESETLALCIADTGMVILTGSAFLNIPSSDAHAMLNSGNVQAHVLQSYEEIANILTRVLSDDGYQHLRLDKVYTRGEYPVFNNKITGFNTKVSFYVEVLGYGTGVITFFVR